MSQANTFGKALKVTFFGESHGVAIGAVIDGFPAGFPVNFSLIDSMISQRKPFSDFETKRNEQDKVEFLSGIDNYISNGSPIAFIIRNTDKRSEDYAYLKNVFRPGHADYVYYKKYGLLPQAGGGRASGRETIARVVAGALAVDFLRQRNIDIISYVSAIGAVGIKEYGKWYPEKDIFASPLRCPELHVQAEMQKLIDEVVASNDSIGGKITTLVKGLPAGIGEPLFEKLNTVLSMALLSIPGAKGIDFGEGFSGIHLKGSQYNDELTQKNGAVEFVSNHSGGIQAGISNGNMLIMNTVFRPASSIGIEQNTIDVSGKPIKVTIKGRHDACYIPRVAIVATSMAAIALMDLFLQNKNFERKL